MLSVDLGHIREYAAASGDRNPIHMGDLPARAFGFSKASPTECGAPQPRSPASRAQLPGEVTYDVQFGKPLLLPAKVNLYTRRIDGKGNFDIEIRNAARTPPPDGHPAPAEHRHDCGPPETGGPLHTRSVHSTGVRTTPHVSNPRPPLLPFSYRESSTNRSAARVRPALA